jgi:hypothetical protein
MPADMPPMVEYAQAAVIEHALGMALSNEFILRATFTDIYRPRCKRLTARRAGCTYRFVIEDTRHGIALHDERGWVQVGRRTVLVPRRILRPTRG